MMYFIVGNGRILTHLHHLVQEIVQKDKINRIIYGAALRKYLRAVFRYDGHAISL